MHVREDDGKGDIKRIPGARWAIGAPVNGEWISLIQDTSATPGDVAKVLSALSIPQEEVEKYFPKNRRGEYCPTFELIRMFDRLRPRPRKDSGTVGV